MICQVGISIIRLGGLKLTILDNTYNKKNINFCNKSNLHFKLRLKLISTKATWAFYNMYLSEDAS
jgi:hypothetical protein